MSWLYKALAFFGIAEGGCCDLDCDDCRTEWDR